MVIRTLLFSSGVFLWMVIPFTTHALSCAPISPTIGFFDAIEDQGEELVHLSLTQPKTFSNPEFTNTPFTNLDLYDTLAKDYAQNPNTFEDYPTYDGFEPQGLTLSKDVQDNLRVNDKDIIINGPPHYVCGLGFTGIFDHVGTLKQAHIKESFYDYTYKETSITVDPEKELDCDRSDGFSGNNVCTVSVRFTIDNEPYILTPGEYVTPRSPLVERIDLLDSSNFKKDPKNPSPYDWGISTFASYVITFNPNAPKKSPENPSFPDHEPQPDPAHTDICSQNIKLSPLQKLWCYVKFWF